MADELELDLTEEQDINKTQERIKNLSSKVKSASEERDTAKAAVETAETARLAAEKERDFFKEFSSTNAKYPAASEYQDQIKEKVLAGYTVEDATVSVLNKEGKFTPTVQQAPQQNVAGGSAPNQVLQTGNKPVSDMSRDERRQALVEAEARGDISIT